MLIDCNQRTPDQNYFTLIQTVVPRPIAWVLSDNGNGSYNLAPFSFFNALASNPGIIMIAVGWKDEAARKDTWVNIAERNDFVVHIPSVGHLKEVAASSATLAHGVSEVDLVHMPLEIVQGQRLPRLKGPKVAFFCTKHSIQELGKDQQGIILGQISHIWIDDTIVRTEGERMYVDPKALDPLARLGGAYYGQLGELLTMKRPI